MAQQCSSPANTTFNHQGLRGAFINVLAEEISRWEKNATAIAFCQALKPSGLYNHGTYYSGGIHCGGDSGAMLVGGFASGA